MGCEVEAHSVGDIKKEKKEERSRKSGGVIVLGGRADDARLKAIMIDI